MDCPRLAIVIPCYNEEDALPQTFRVLLRVLDQMVKDRMITEDSYLMCVNDGSRDKTWQLIKEAHDSEPRIKGISLAHNRGHQNALRAGLNSVMDRCDACVSIDADLQDDPNAIITMMKRFAEGAEIVFGVRSSRATDSWFKRTSAESFYKVQKSMGVKAVYNHADFRLMSKRALHLFAEYGESNLYMRGIIAQLGLKTATVEYPRAARTAGETKYPLSKQIALSIDGITSFTAKPMRLIFTTGLVLLFIDIIIAIWALAAYFSGTAMTGWTSLILSVWFLGSLILMSIGIIGEYIGKIYTEVKHRPHYAIEEEIF